MDHRLIRAFLFDLDGVVVFTDRFHQLGWQTLAGEEGWEFPEALSHSLRGISRMESLDRILAHNRIDKSAEERQAFADRKNSIYVKAVAGISAGDIVPGALDFIRRTREGGVQTALCSASKNAPAVLEALGIASLFDVVVCGLDIERSKPDPQVFSMAAERLGVPPFHCMVFEDAVSGIEAAGRAGMKSIGVGTPEAIPNAPEVLPDFLDADLDAILTTGRLHRIRPEPWTLTQTSFRKARANYWESLFALSNGRIGVRGSLEESAWPDAEYPATFHNGVFAGKPYEHLGGYVPLRGGKFCINAVCGPDEYNCGVNNNTYTNVMARWHLDFAADVYDRMRAETPEKLAALVERCGFSEAERDAWRAAAGAMFIPWNGELGIHPQDDNFLNLEPVDMTRIPMHTDIREKMHPLKLWRTQVCKQADVVLMLLVQSHLFPREVKEADFDFYEARTNHGSSLSACIHAVISAELERVEEAYRFFVLSAHMDLNDFKSNVAGGSNYAPRHTPAHHQRASRVRGFLTNSVHAPPTRHEASVPAAQNLPA